MKKLIASLAVAAALAGCGSSEPAKPRFSHTVDHPWFPLTPGTTFTYRGVKDGKPSRDVVTVGHATKSIQGAPCTVVTDLLYLSGKLEERTTDWYAQDDQGNVWYLGERTADFTGGRVDTSGSWQAGVHGARPGIVMTANPQVGDTHRQEYLAGEAEDQYWLVDLNQHVTVPLGAFRHAALTLEWSRLEPNVIDRKLYVRGIGVVSERAAQGPPEVAELVSFTHP